MALGASVVHLSARAVVLAAFAFAAVLPRSASAGTFSLLSYNVAGLLEGISGSHPEANHPQISPLLNAYDVVLVQESFPFYHDLLTADLEHPYQSVLDESTRPPVTVPVGDGLNTFSRLPFSDFTRVTWTDCFGLLENASDCLAPKGFSMQRHELAPGSFLDVYNWHADAGGDAEDLAARRSNVRQLYEFIAAHSEGNAVIVAGDTNSRYTRAGDILPEMLSAVGLTDVWVELERGGLLPSVGPSLSSCADPSSGSCERVDKILYRSSDTLLLEALEHEVPAALFTDAAGVPLSDHDPVYALFGYTVVPEPGTALLLGAGLLALARRRGAPRAAP